MNGDSVKPFYLTTTQDLEKAKKSPTGVDIKGWRNDNLFKSRKNTLL